MKTILINILALVVVLAAGIPLIGGTFATWSDSETMEGNYIETGSLDLMIAKCEADWQNPGMFNDDEPWGLGLDPCFSIPEVALNSVYSAYLLLWNAGCVDGVAYLHLQGLPEDNSLALSTTLQVWYDHDADPATPVELVATGLLADLGCQEIELGLLETDQMRQLKLELITAPTPASGSLSFSIYFELIQLELIGPTYGWADTEHSQNALNTLIELGGSPGFWGGPGALNLYGKGEIVGWFTTIVGSSKWFTDVTLTGDVDDDYATMQGILSNSGANKYKGMVRQFRAQYLATRLNTMPDPPRLQMGTIHDISDIEGAEAYFGFDTGTLAEIIAFIEGEAEGGIFEVPPTKDEVEILKNVCDFLNDP
jgi:predicted ribosomally synthesized peptide with SipW-like signal peptide